MEGDLTSGLRERSDIMLKMMDRWEEDVKATQYVRKADVIGRLQRQMEEEFAAIDRLSAQVLEKIALERAERMALIKSTSANLVKPGPLSLTPGMLSRLGEVAPEATKEKQKLPSQGIVTPPPSKRSHSDMIQGMDSCIAASPISYDDSVALADLCMCSQAQDQAQGNQEKGD